METKEILSALKELKEQVEEIKKYISQTMEQKEMLTTDEVINYMGISKSQLYKLTSSNEIPYYKPSGKLMYFNREEIVEWIKEHKEVTNKEIIKCNKDIFNGYY